MSLQVLIVLSILKCSESGRVQLKTEDSGPLTYVPDVDNPTRSETTPVKILVTRHALSWANVAAYWMDTWQHIHFRDALLTQIGMAKSREAGIRVKSWLEAHDLKIDDVMASKLVRAMQTATLQYPGQTVQVVPFISETGPGQDNVPREPKDQINRMHAHLNAPEDFSVDYKWAELLDEENGRMFSQKWSNFLKFLEKHYLPEFLRMRDAKGVPRNAPVVLAVVTHSNFMGDADIAGHCDKHYPVNKKGNKKANNNQVVLLPYDFIATTHQAWDSTVRYSLFNAGECLDVDQGISDIDPSTGKRHELCMTDIGEDCYKYAYEKCGGYPPIIDDALRSDYVAIKADQYKIEELNTNIKNPPEPAFSFFKSETKEELVARYKLELAQLEQKVPESIATLRQNVQKTCWIGGSPIDPESEHGSLN